MKLWLDDRRKPPWGYDLWARDFDEAVALLTAHKDLLEHVSLDHDLADAHYESAADGGYGVAPTPIDRSKYKEKTGYDVALYMVEHGLWPTTSVYVHSLNGTGAADMIALLTRHAPAHITIRRVWPPSP